MQKVTPGEFVVVQGLQGTEMFFVKSGRLEVRMSIGEDAVKKLLTASSRYANRAKPVCTDGSDCSMDARPQTFMHRVRRWITPVRVCSVIAQAHHPPQFLSCPNGTILPFASGEKPLWLCLPPDFNQ